MAFVRSSGVLLHPTSLPGPYGIGELSSHAYRWVDFLAGAGCSLWQVLPLGPTGYGDSPYQCFSAFAGNPYLISFERLLEEGLLLPEDFQEYPSFPDEQVDFGGIYHHKLPVLDKAFTRFKQGGFASFENGFATFQDDNASWLNDFALFMALKEVHGGAPWSQWSEGLRLRKSNVISKAIQVHAEAIERHAFRQYLFFQQWGELKAYANAKGVQIVGDIPIFVALDSADVWANRELFFLDKDGNPTVVAGVPPDYFSATGQLWGNPLYRWDVHKKSGYAWWMDRFRAVLKTVDIIRLDHFRGFAGYWEIPASAKTAIEGNWVPGPGADFFQVLKVNLGELPIIAEDLGEITADVDELREKFDLPGMKILVFAFSEADNGFLPHKHTQNCVVYTGTHDNDTVMGWYRRVSESERDLARRYLARDGHDIAWDLIRAAWGSVAVFSITTMQDLLSLGNEARMNYPSQASGNWVWRVKSEAFTESLRLRMVEQNYLYERLNPVSYPRPTKAKKK